MELIIASANAHKIEEILNLLPPSITLRSANDVGITEDIPETSSTIEGNAIQKAQYIYDRFKVNCFADDTGLEVAALDNAPGVHSARYATDGHDHAANVALLLNNLDGKTNRKARFRTVIALYWNDKQYLFEGIVTGQIGLHPIGDLGFGYDPIFIPDGQNDGLQLTFAQMTLDDKNIISHRARATRALVEFLQKKCISH